MTLSQIVRDRFDEITYWTSEGVPWPEISERIAKPDLSFKANSVYVAYRKELARRQSPKRATALKWSHANYESIRELVDLGYDWTAIPILLPLETQDGEAVTPTLSMLVREFNAIDSARASRMPTRGIPDLHGAASQPTDPQTGPPVSPAVTTVESHIPAQTTEPRSEPSDAVHTDEAPPAPLKAPDQATAPSEPTPPEQWPPRPRVRRTDGRTALRPAEEPTPDPVLDQPDPPERLPDPDLIVPPWSDPEPASPKPGQARPERKSLGIQPQLEAEKARRTLEAQKKAEKEAARYHKPYHEPSCDPYVSAEEYRNKMSLILARRDALLPSLHAAQGDQKDVLQYQIDEIYGELKDVEGDFFTRFSHRQAQRSTLCILSSAALSCGVFKVVDGSDPNAAPTAAAQPIKLQGYDRPDQEIASTRLGPDPMPDPLYIIEDLAEDELARIAEAYATDQSEFPEFNHASATHPRRLAEAVVVRGAYEYRYSGWVDYDAYIKLKGADYPSPTLTQTQTPYLHQTSLDDIPIVELAPKLIGKEPDRKKLEYSQRVDLVNSRGMWFGHAV